MLSVFVRCVTTSHHRHGNHLHERKCQRNKSSMNIGSGSNGQLTFLDIVALLSFYIGLENLDLNIGQSDLDRQTQELDARLRENIKDIHDHLRMQDEKLDKLLGEKT